MRLCIALTVSVMMVPAWSQDHFRVPLQPLDFQKQEAYLSSINQLETDGKRIVVRSLRETEVVVIDRQGKILDKLGGKGGGPAEFGEYGVLAVAASNGLMFGIDAERKNVRLFEGSQFIDSFHLNSYNLGSGAMTSNAFAFSESEVVIPSHPGTGSLAAVYDFNGRLLRHFGDFPQQTLDLGLRLNAVNDTFWLFGGDRWYSVHKYLPLVTIYDRDFKIIKQFPVHSGVLDALAQEVEEFEPNPQHATSPPIISDVKLHNGKLYLMARGCLHRVEPKSGKVEGMAWFYGEGADFAGVTTPNVALFFFTILDDGEFVLGHPGMMWNHDLWKARVPWS